MAGNAPQTPSTSVKTPAHAAQTPGMTQASQLVPAVEGTQMHLPGSAGAEGSVISSNPGWHTGPMRLCCGVGPHVPGTTHCRQFADSAASQRQRPSAPGMYPCAGVMKGLADHLHPCKGHSCTRNSPTLSACSGAAHEGCIGARLMRHSDAGRSSEMRAKSLALVLLKASILSFRREHLGNYLTHEHKACTWQCTMAQQFHECLS